MIRFSNSIPRGKANRFVVKRIFEIRKNANPINQYVGLKVGMIVSGSWYVAYLAAMALRWTPGEVNISASTSTGAAMVCTGFVFTYPAIYLLAYSPKYQMSDGSYLIDSALLLPNSWSLAGIALVASILGGFLGVLYFIIFRRVWLVEDPLPLPGFEASVKLMDIAQETSTGSVESAKQSIFLVGVSSLIVGVFTFFRDFPLFKTGVVDVAGEAVKISALDKIANTIGIERFYNAVDFMVPFDNALTKYTWLGFNLTPMMVAIGWFMKFRVASVSYTHLTLPTNREV